MKKILLIALAAASLAACTKTEANFTASQEISFKPVAKYDTKAAVSGTTYSENYPFYVYANAKSDGHSTFNSKYFEKVLFVNDDNNKTGGLQVYKGQTPQYWPNVNPLVFAGFTQTGNVATITPEAGPTLESLALAGYTQPVPTASVANDLMYFFADNSAAGYTKNNTYVDPVMKHACSWITINVMADAKLVTYWNDLKVTNIHFVNLHETGTVTFTNGTDGLASWDFTGKTPTQNVNVLTQQKTIAATHGQVKDLVEFANIPNNTIVLPQTPVQLSVTYSYTTPAGVPDFTETKVLPLDYDGVDGTNTAWQPGKHYTYNLTLTAEEIKIAPSSDDWTTGSNSHINF